MNDRTDPPPIKEWLKEQQSITAAKYAVCYTTTLQEHGAVTQGHGEYYACGRTGVTTAQGAEYETVKSNTRGRYYTASLYCSNSMG